MNEVISLADTVGASDDEWYRAYAAAPSGERFAALATTLVEEDVVVVPTLSISQAVATGRDATLLPAFRTELAPEADVADWWADGWRERHPQYYAESEEEARLLATVYVPGMLAILRGYHDRGVQIGVGTDVGNSWMTPGVSFHHELGLYQEAGIPPLDILTMATRNGAAALGILPDAGTIAEGKLADLVVLGSDPQTDIAASRDIRLVFLAGRMVFSRATPTINRTGTTPQ
jgi:hypothetical protein